MPTKNTSPYATTFKSAIKRGTPCSVAVNNIATRTKKSPTVVYNSLYKSGLVDRQKFNGQWVYWATFAGKSNATVTKGAQWNLWQCFVDWCIASGNCTPEQLSKKSFSQNEFMTFCKKYWNRQFNTATASRKRSTTKGRKTRATNRKRSTTRTSTPRNYKFPTVKPRTTSRRIRKAA